ncbi:unnamed protein product [Cyprideis torosa]|uniref:Uncharacterized protein n=1 Tax=Cyprideis torosa TaxID=163714 RepID=A0A7R8WSL8_9CRUS|nr:unnamed protein product [Cyprideis torosa]CAG0909498.1 unnamed protein product [Cyprideis torosa]
MSVRNPECDHLKLVLIGDTGVGKTSLLRRYQTDIFSDSYFPTTGVCYVTGDCCELDGETFKIGIYQAERPISSRVSHEEFLSAFYDKAHGIIIVYDCTDQESFTNVRQWLEEIER